MEISRNPVWFNASPLGLHLIKFDGLSLVVAIVVLNPAN